MTPDEQNLDLDSDNLTEDDLTVDDIETDQPQFIAEYAPVVEINVPLVSPKKCTFCDSIETKSCLKCTQNYCYQHAARFTPNFCQDCFKSLQVVLDKYTRISEDYDSTTDQLTTRKESCTRIMIDGPSYVFYTAWINQLSDEEMRSVFEFHYFIVKLIEHENETRVIKRKDSLKKYKVPASPISLTTTTETKTKKTAKPKDMRAELRKLGLPEAVIDAMLAAGQGAV